MGRAWHDLYWHGENFISFIEYQVVEPPSRMFEARSSPKDVRVSFNFSLKNFESEMLFSLTNSLSDSVIEMVVT